VTGNYGPINVPCAPSGLAPGTYYLRARANFSVPEPSYNFSLLCQPCDDPPPTPTPTATPG